MNGRADSEILEDTASGFGEGEMPGIRVWEELSDPQVSL